MGKKVNLKEDFNQLKILAENIDRNKKFGDRTIEFMTYYRQFVDNIRFCFRDLAIDTVSRTKINKDGLDRLSDAIEDLEGMKKIAQECNDNNLVGFIDSTLTYLKETKQRLIPLIK